MTVITTSDNCIFLFVLSQTASDMIFILMHCSIRPHLLHDLQAADMKLKNMCVKQGFSKSETAGLLPDKVWEKHLQTPRQFVSFSQFL